jgi:hypothetical protein
MKWFEIAPPRCIKSLVILINLILSFFFFNYIIYFFIFSFLYLLKTTRIKDNFLGFYLLFFRGHLNKGFYMSYGAFIEKILFKESVVTTLIAISSSWHVTPNK